MADTRCRGRAAVVVTTVVLACCLAGCGNAKTSSLAVSRSARLQTARFPDLRATALVDGSGFAVYVFAPDDRRAVTCTGTCALTWPPVTVPAHTRPALGSGVRPDLVGTITAAGGAHVVTYNGWPLYTYTGDVRSGIASGQDIDLNGGAWYLVQPDGSPLTSAGGTSAGGPAAP